MNDRALTFPATRQMTCSSPRIACQKWQSGGKIPCWLVGLILSVALIQPGHAADVSDHDRARQALEAGEILPLKTVLEKVDRDTPGQVMEVELERHNQRWVYEIKLLRPGGSLVKLKVDARDGTILRHRDQRPGNER